MYFVQIQTLINWNRRALNFRASFVMNLIFNLTNIERALYDTNRNLNGSGSFVIIYKSELINKSCPFATLH